MNRFAAAFCGVYVFILLIQNPMGTRWIDFPVYWEAGARALSHSTVYDFNVVMQYRYSPFVALLFGWAFRPFDFETASWIFQKLSLITWVVLFVEWTKFAFGSVRNRFVVWAALLVLFGNALRLDLQFGQVNSFTLWLLYQGWKDAEAERNENVPWYRIARAGFWFAMAISLKLYAVIAMVFLVFQWRVRTGLWTVFFLAALSYGGLAVYHGHAFAVEELINWGRLITSSTPGMSQDLTNINVLGVVGRLVHPGVAKAVWLLGLVTYLVVAWRFRHRSPLETYAIAGAAMYFLHPLTWTYWVLFLVPFFLIGVARYWPASTRFQEGFPWVLWLLPAFLTFNMQHSHFVKEWPLWVASLLFVVWVIPAMRNSGQTQAQLTRSPT